MIKNYIFDIGSVNQLVVLPLDNGKIEVHSL